MELALKNIQRLIYHKTQTTQLIVLSTLFIHLLTVNGSKYCYVIPIIQFRHTLKGFQVFLCNTNNSI